MGARQAVARDSVVGAMLNAPSSARGVEALLRDHARPGVVLDVGAYHGDFIRDALATGRFSRAYAFEPNPDNLAQLGRLFAPPSPVAIIPKAVGARAHRSSFHFGSDPTTGSLLPFTDRSAEAAERDVEVTTLDSEIFEGPVSVVKIDTQGGDLDVLKGAERLVTEQHPIVLVELIFSPLYQRQASPFDIMQWLASRGYAMAGFFNEHYGGGWLAFADAIFIPTGLAPVVPSRFDAVPERDTLDAEITMLRGICAERLELIDRLDSDLRRATGAPDR